MANEEASKVIGIIKDLRIAMVSTHSAGKLASRPLTLIEASEQGELWFFSTADSEIVHEIRAQGLVNAAFSGSKAWVSVSGQAQVVQDVAKKKELWNTAVETFASEGPESAQTVLLRIDADSAEYWENPGGAASLVAGWVKQKLTGKPAEPGDSNTVEL
ncbi:MAG TPA: pyridoxamine 5'-phosphate oxidase [Glutamicibacter sp.]|uniref:FMN binding domain-containing protein n=1 Tax=Glutamicibacter arilaitensis (strain DSM 16368 / CIP 108037 / IAM 15318 / JCM 13566 / NCIMB 14258 / Re117) TaxID=861360 RepID=A0ABP1U2E0_GLUAR|nr:MULTISPECIES: pyridoxamine 5'-phosphate oxidase family protein [Glutamicibacter]CBT75692.1 FMN binding domain-containing protein [Glutamicibacter arilaitensis Re117]HCH48195.1 pyridoxamine 5'-phosphate oxidase [Glutamicibacter sp.]